MIHGELQLARRTIASIRKELTDAYEVCLFSIDKSIPFFLSHTLFVDDNNGFVIVNDIFVVFFLVCVFLLSGGFFLYVNLFLL